MVCVCHGCEEGGSCICAFMSCFLLLNVVGGGRGFERLF